MHRTTRFHALWSVLPVLALSLDLNAQTPKTGSPPKTGRERIVQEVEERSKRFREGRVIQSHVRVTINLVNGNRLSGVVKDGRFVERHDGLRFTQAVPGESKVGIRLWYSDKTNSYIFLPFASIKRYRIGERLTDDQVKSLGEAFQKAAAERAAEVRARAEQKKGAEKPGGAGGKGVVKPKAEGPKLTEAQKELLENYPPSEGWGEAKLKELERRSVVIGVFPNAIEKRFIENFNEWAEAVRIQEEIDQLESQKTPTPGTPPVGGPPMPAPAKGSGPAPTGGGPILVPPSGTGGPQTGKKTTTGGR